MIRRPPRSTQSRSSAASDVYKRQGAERTGFGLSTPLKPMFPNAGETRGACAADGAATARTSVAAGALAVAGVTSVAAEAGRAKEAAMPPETTITAEALAAGLAEREMAVDSDETGFKRPWERWRPEMVFDTVDKPC